MIICTSNKSSRLKPLEFKENKNGCFEVINRKPTYKGYFRFMRGLKTYLAHRFIYEQCFGKIPKELLVCHKCDNRACINPEHLFLGTNKDNIIDAMNKGRMQKAEKHRDAKLNRKQVRQIRLEAKKYKRTPIKMLSKKYKVNKSTIYDIVTYKTWKFI